MTDPGNEIFLFLLWNVESWKFTWLTKPFVPTFFFFWYTLHWFYPKGKTKMKSLDSHPTNVWGSCFGGDKFWIQSSVVYNSSSPITTSLTPSPFQLGGRIGTSICAPEIKSDQKVSAWSTASFTHHPRELTLESSSETHVSSQTWLLKQQPKLGGKISTCSFSLPRLAQIHQNIRKKKLYPEPWIQLESLQRDSLPQCL